MIPILQTTREIRNFKSQISNLKSQISNLKSQIRGPNLESPLSDLQTKPRSPRAGSCGRGGEEIRMAAKALTDLIAAASGQVDPSEA
jgi:hypothetical protein